MSLWKRIQFEFAIEDAAGVELLAQACAAADRVEALATRIAADCELLETKNGPKAHPCLREELSNRAFVVRTFAEARRDA